MSQSSYDLYPSISISLVSVYALSILFRMSFLTLSHHLVHGLSIGILFTIFIFYAVRGIVLLFMFN